MTMPTESPRESPRQPPAEDLVTRFFGGPPLSVLFRLALDQAPAGAQLRGAAEDGIEVREIAATIGRHLGIPAVSIPADQAAEHFKAFPFITMDITMPSAITRELVGWEPTRPGLIADL